MSQEGFRIGIWIAVLNYDEGGIDVKSFEVPSPFIILFYFNLESNLNILKTVLLRKH